METYLEKTPWTEAKSLDEASYSEALLGALRLRCAVELYRRENGSSPAALERLVPNLLFSIPRDPFAPTQTLQLVAGQIVSRGYGRGANESAQEYLVPARVPMQIQSLPLGATRSAR